jgi:hypothetical protein
MIVRSMERFDLNSTSLTADSAYGSALAPAEAVT